MTDATTYDVKINVKDAAVRPAFANLQNSIDRVGKSTGLSTLAAGAKSAQIQMEALGASITAMLGPIAAVVGGFSVINWLKSAATGAVDFGNQLYIASQQTGVAADALAKFHYIGKAVNVDAAQMDKALYRLNLTVQKAATGKDKNAAAMFNTLHIPIRDAHGHIRGLTGIFADLSDAIHKHPALAQLIAGTAFGSRGAQAMIPVLMEGRAEINKLGDAFDQAYGKITPASVEAAHKTHEAWERFGVALDGLKYRLGMMLAPALTYATVKLTNLLTTAENFASKLSLDSVGRSFSNVGTAMHSVWDSTEPLRSAFFDLAEAMNPDVADQFDRIIQNLPQSMRDATPAVRDFLNMFKGDTGASLRTLARLMDLLAASLRVVGEVSKWASSQMAVFHGKQIDLSPPSKARLQAAWEGKKLAPFPAPKPSTGNITYWDWGWIGLGKSAGSKSPPIGIRLNNPMDLRSWGSAPTVQTGSGRFARFPTMEAGVSAAAGNLLAYARHGWTTLDKIISHWAPSSENNTRSYIDEVARRTGFKDNQTLNLRDPATVERLLSAMAIRETGVPLSQSIIHAGVSNRLGSAPKNGRVDVSVKVEAPRGTATKVTHHRGDTVGDLDVGRSWANA
jgi:hypothetical protein